MTSFKDHELIQHKSILDTTQCDSLDTTQGFNLDTTYDHSTRIPPQHMRIYIGLDTTQVRRMTPDVVQTTQRICPTCCPQLPRICQ